MDEYHGVIGAPELTAVEGMSVRIRTRKIRIDAEEGFRTTPLGQLEGTVLALDWVVDQVHHIWGSAVLVGPGVALTARHVFEDMLAAGLARGEKGYLMALGFDGDVLDLWNVVSLSNFHNGSDLAVITLVRANGIRVRC